MKSIMNHNFSRIPPPQIQRSTFDRSHGLKTTFNSGYLVPCFVDEILPGDTVKFIATFLARLSTFIFPIMDNIFLDTFFFFVPTRLLWTNWEKFNGAQINPGDSTDFLIPHIAPASGALTFNPGTLMDYMGLPTNVTINAVDYPSALPLRAYLMIWNEWFRDQNLQNTQFLPTGDGPDDPNDFQLLKRGKRHDYFSSCLPWPQKGDSVMLPLGDSAPVIGDGLAIGITDTHNNYGLFSSNVAYSGMYETGMSTNFYGASVGATGTGAGTVPPGSGSTKNAVGLTTDPAKSGMIADLTAATAATINQLRQAFQYQKILERDARGGTRYTEMLKAHFGVTNPDFRLQRPEYLGGSSQRINVSSVPQTSVTGTTPQANLAAYSVAHAQAHFTKSFTEHGYIIGLSNVRADVTYQNGMAKLWSRKTRFDFYLPALAHLGEQAVFKKEINYQTASASEVFGYQERWAEYRYKPSYVTGYMRSNSGAPLDAWHLALDFGATAPDLNNVFIQDSPPIDRVVAVSEADTDQIIMDCYFAMHHTRPMPTYSVPGQIDRF